MSTETETLIEMLDELSDTERNAIAKHYGWTVPRKRAESKPVDPSKPAPVKVTRRQMNVAHLYAANEPSQGATDARLEEWLEAHHKADWKLEVAVTVGEGKPKKLARGQWADVEGQWNASAKGYWSAKARQEQAA